MIRRLLARFLNWVSRDQPQLDKFVVLRLPRVTTVDPRHKDAPPAMVTHALNASNDAIAAAFEGTRSAQIGERTTWPAKGWMAFTCCDCGLTHKLDYEPAANERNEMVLSMTVTVNRELTDKLRRTYPWPVITAQFRKSMGKQCQPQ